MSDKYLVRVYHTEYGCDTGCCGHVIELPDGQSKFNFAHPDIKELKDPRQWAHDIAKSMLEEEFGIKHTFDLDWENCRIEED